MAIIRQGNWLGQQRVDVPDLRSIESAVGYDFDVLAGIVMTGKRPLVVKGFSISTLGMVGARADALQLNVADSVLLHYGASESGTVYVTPASATVEVLSATNGKVQGTFTSSATNYVGLDFQRTKDASTSDLTKFLDADGSGEIAQTIPKARILSYRIVISTQPFSTATNIAPIAIVVTDAYNRVASVADARQLFFRLGSGNDTPNEFNYYDWSSGRRENYWRYDTTHSNDPFVGGDKVIDNFKSWMDAVMSSIWELRGGEYWYSPQHRDNVKLIYGTRINTQTGDNFYYNAGVLTWKGLSLLFENGNNGYINNINDGSATMNADGQCLYVDLDRSQNLVTSAPYTSGGLTAVVSTLAAVSNTAGIPGRRFIIAWRYDGKIHCRDKAYPIDRDFRAATPSITGMVRVNHKPSDFNGDDSNPITPIIQTTNGKVVAEGISMGDGVVMSGPLIIGGQNGDTGVDMDTGGGGGNVTVGASNATKVELGHADAPVNIKGPTQLAGVGYSTILAGGYINAVRPAFNLPDSNGSVSISPFDIWNAGKYYFSTSTLSKTYASGDFTGLINNGETKWFMVWLDISGVTGEITTTAPLKFTATTATVTAMGRKSDNADWVYLGSIYVNRNGNGFFNNLLSITYRNNIAVLTQDGTNLDTTGSYILITDSGHVLINSESSLSISYDLTLLPDFPLHCCDPQGGIHITGAWEAEGTASSGSNGYIRMLGDIGAIISTTDALIGDAPSFASETVVNGASNTSVKFTMPITPSWCSFRFSDSTLRWMFNRSLTGITMGSLNVGLNAYIKQFKDKLRPVR